MQKTLPNPLSPATVPANRSHTFSVFNRRVLPLLSLGLLLVAWQIVTMLKLYPPFIIPPPLAVVNKFGAVIADGSLWLHTSTTLFAVVVGLAVGLGVGVILGYLIAKNPLL